MKAPVRMVRVYRRPDKPPETRRWRLGDMIEYDESDDLPYYEFFDFPDPDHQSSLDYLEGV